VPEEGFRAASAFVQVDPDTDGFKERLQAALDEAVAGTSANVKVGLDTADFDAKYDEVKGKLDAIDGREVSAKVGLDTAGFDGKSDDAKAKLDELDGKEATAKLGLDKDDFDAKRDDAEADLDEMEGMEASPKLGLDDEEFREKLGADKAALTAAGSSGGSEGEGSLLGALTIGVGSLMPGLGGAAAGLGMLGATGALALGGVAKALEAHSQASQSAGTTGAQLASTAFSNSVAQQQAAQAVGQAQQQAAQDAVQSADTIKSAQMSLAETVRNAAASQVQAEQSVIQAQQGVEESNYGLSQAQYNLSQAWVQAREQLVSLRDAEADATLNVKAAALAVQQAAYQQTLTDQNAMSTSLDKQQAALAVAQAEQQLTDAKDQSKDATVAATTADKQGVAGSQLVIQAKQGVTSAQYAMTDAQKAYIEAQKNLVTTELNNADAIKAAQMSVVEAQEQAAYTQERDSQAIVNAQRNVTDTYKEQQLQAAATASTANSAANQFVKDMGRLSPAGREVVRELLSMRGALHELETIAQTAIAPGLVLFLQGIQKIMPVVDSGVRAMGKAIGSAFGDFGKVMQTPAFAQGMAGLIANGIQFAQIVLPAFAQFLQQMGILGSKQGAVTGLADALAGIAQGLTGLAKGLIPYIPAFNSILQMLGKLASEIGPALAQSLGIAAQALEPIMKFLSSPAGTPVVQVLAHIAAYMLIFKGFQKLVPFEGIAKGFGMIKGLPETLGKVAGGIKGIGSGEGILSKAGGWFSSLGTSVSGAASAIAGKFSGAWSGLVSFGSKIGPAMSGAASSVAGFVSGMVSGLASAAKATVAWVAEHAVATAAFIAENVAQAASATAAFVAENAATLGIAAAIGLLIAGVVYAATHWTQVWHAMSDVVDWVGAHVGQVISDVITGPFGDLEKAALWLWHNVFDPVFHGIGQLAVDWYDSAMKPEFDLVIGAMHALEDAALWMWHNVFTPVFSGIEAGARAFVSGFSAVWGRLEGAFKAPVNFLIKTVYDDGIAKLWNDVVTHIGLSSIKLPVIAGLAGGGIVPGRDTGRDTQLVAMRPQEGVLVPGAVRAIGPGTVHALNAAYGDGGRSSSGAVPHFGGGGILGDIGGWLSDVGKGIVGAAKFAADFATDPGGAVSTLLDHVIGTTAAGDLGKVMTAIPKTIVTDLAHVVMSAVTGGGGGKGISAPGPVSGTVSQWFSQAVKLAKVPVSWIPDLETIAHYESGDNPNAINLSDSNAAAGDPSRGIMQEIMTTFLAHHVPGTSMNIYDPVANIASASRYILSRYGSVSNVPGIVSLEHGGGYVGYDGGGWLMPGMTPANQTGKPEAVLTPEESAAFVAIARHMTQQGVGGTGQAPVVNMVYQGTQWPTPEQKAMQMRDLALVLGGVSPA
jgi:SLT domain-containing protein/chemotaxis protein histidine kinase CheA